MPRCGRAESTIGSDAIDTTCKPALPPDPHQRSSSQSSARIDNGRAHEPAGAELLWYSGPPPNEPIMPDGPFTMSARPPLDNA